MKKLKTKYVYTQFNGLIGYETDGKYKKIVYEEPNPPWPKRRNIGGVQCPTV